MTYLVFFLAISLLLLILLILSSLWLRRGSALAGGGEPSQAAGDLDGLELELPSRTLAERIFGLQDWEFVSRQAPLEIRRMFLRERRAVAICWLCHTRRQAICFIGFYLKTVRRIVCLSPAMELELAFRFVLFLLESEASSLLIWLGGPIFSRRMVGYAVNVAQRLSYISAQVLESVETGIDGISTGSAERTATS